MKSHSSTHNPSSKKFIASLALVVAGAMHPALAAPVVATPGSLAGYTYYPPSSTSSGGQGGENVSTLQRCYWAANQGDLTVNLSTKNWYGLEKTTVYYKMVGGDGGRSPHGFGTGGGGGGSSAIIQNGNPIAIANGANGNTTSLETNGKFTLTKTDTLRFITGGAGGDGYCGGGQNCIGGGGGAGYRGGGAGASAMNATFKTYTSVTHHGGGGTDNVGAGGYHDITNINSGQAYSGTAGLNESGGVAGYPSTASTGTIGASGDGAYGSAPNPPYAVNYTTANHRATPTAVGSPQGPYKYYNPSTYVLETYYFGGGGGRFGMGSQPGVFMPAEYGNIISWAPGSIRLTGPRYPGNPGVIDIKWVYLITSVSEMPQPTEFVMSRPIPDDSFCGSIGMAGSFCTNRHNSRPGRIMVMYQAESCELFQ